MATCDPATSTNPTTQTLGEQKFPFLWSKVHMRIVNNLGDNQPVTVHCKSKNDDLQAHVLYDGQSLRWHFRPNFWGTTLFFCGFSWARGEGVYDIYKSRRDMHRCRHQCDWYVRQDGVAGYTEENEAERKPPKLDILFKWQNP